MNSSRLHYLIREPRAAEGFRTGVSLHSHTMHSKESTAFVERLAKRYPLFDWFIRGQLKKYSLKYGDAELKDLGRQTRRMWWTTPLSAGQAFQVEKGQIEKKLGLRPIVSISDHDNIDAPLQLQMLAENWQAPISVEWTTPYEATYFHVGVHNMSPAWAAEMMRRMERFTANSNNRALREMFEELNEHRDVLIILNHPYWDQAWIGAERHDACLKGFLADYGDIFHAAEINGLRSWTENRKVVKMAREIGMPLISGGDRHGREPNATLNLTNAATFAEFAEEVRAGESHVLVMPQFHDPLLFRVFLTMWDVLRDHPEHAEGRVTWAERMYRRCNDEEVRTFAAFFEGRDPKLMRGMIRAVQFLTCDRVRPAWQRMAPGSEAAL